MIPENVDYLFANTYKNFEKAERKSSEYSVYEYEVIYILEKYGYDEEKLGTCIEKEQLRDMADASNEELVANYKDILKAKKEQTKEEGTDEGCAVTYSDLLDDIRESLQRELQYRMLIYKQSKNDKYCKIYGLNKKIGFEPTENMAKKNQDFMDNILASDFGKIIGIDYLQEFEAHNWGKGVSYFTCLVLAYWYVIKAENDEGNFEQHLFGKIPEYSAFWRIVKRAYYALEGEDWNISQEEWILFLREIINACQCKFIDAAWIYDYDEHIETRQTNYAIEKEDLLEICNRINNEFRDIHFESVKGGDNNKKKIIDNSLSRKKMVGNVSEVRFKEYLSITVVFWRMTIKRNPFISSTNILKKRIEVNNNYLISIPEKISYKKELEAKMDEIRSSMGNVESCLSYKDNADNVDSATVLRKYEGLLKTYFELINKLIEKKGKLSFSKKTLEFYLFEQLYAPYYLCVASKGLKRFMEKRHLQDLDAFSDIFDLLAQLAVMPYAQLRVALCEKVMREWLIIEFNKHGSDNMRKIAKNIYKEINKFINLYVEYEKEMVFALADERRENFYTIDESDDMCKWYERERKSRGKKCDLDDALKQRGIDDLYMKIYEKLLTAFVKKRLSRNIYTI